MGEVGRRPPRIGSLDGLTTGKRIAALRIKKNLSVAQLAAAAEMSSQGIQKLEADGSNEPSYFNGLRIADALGVTPWALAGEPEPIPSNLSVAEQVLHARRQMLAEQPSNVSFLVGDRPGSLEDHLATMEQRILKSLQASQLREFAKLKKMIADRLPGLQPEQDRPQQTKANRR